MIVDVDYDTGITAPKYSFWISEDRGIVLILLGHKMAALSRCQKLGVS